MKDFVLWLPLLLGVPAVVYSEPQIKVEVSSPRFLEFYNEGRDFAASVELAKAAFLTSTQNRILYEDLFRRDMSQYQKRAISLIMLKRSNYQRDLAVAQEDSQRANWEQFIERQRVCDLEAAYAKGAPVSIEELHGSYVKMWAAQCRGTAKDVVSGRALVRLNEFLFKFHAELNPSGASSYYELAIAERDLISARNDLAARIALDVGCPKNLPTLEEVKAIRSPSIHAQLWQFLKEVRDFLTEKSKLGPPGPRAD